MRVALEGPNVREITAATGATKPIDVLGGGDPMALIAVEVKATAAPTRSDGAHLS